MPAAVAVSPRYDRLIGVIELACLLTVPLWAYELFFAWDHESWTRFLLVPLIVALNLAGAVRVARGDPFLQRVLPVALLYKLAATAGYLYMAVEVYHFTADAFHYYNEGMRLAEEFSLAGHWQWLRPVWSHNFVITLTGGIYVLTGASMVVGCVIFAMVSFWGEYLAYRVVRTAFPNGDHEFAGTLLFFLPSIAFWTASIGKDALIFTGIVMAVYGFAKLQRELAPGAFLVMAGGLGTATLVRPHVGGMLGLAMLVSFLLGGSRRGAAALAGKLFSAPLLVAGTYLLFARAEEFLKLEDFSESGRVIAEVGHNSAAGGSVMSTATSLLSGVLSAPFLLFRPFPWEVHNLQAAIAGAEGLMLLAIFVWRRRSFIAEVRQWRRNSTVLFILLFATEFSVIFAAAIRNFGLLTRERVMLSPLVLMLFCAVPLAAHANSAARVRRFYPAPDTVVQGQRE